MANNCKQCFNTHYQPHCHPLPKAYGCVAVYIAGRRTNLVVYGWRPKPPTKNVQANILSMYIIMSSSRTLWVKCISDITRLWPTHSFLCDLVCPISAWRTFWYSWTDRCSITYIYIYYGTPVSYIYIYIYTLLAKKGCYTPIEDNKTNVDRTFVFPLGWNWHDMDPWLFPNEIRHYLGQTFNARSSGIVEPRNHSIGGRSPKSIFTVSQLWINICIFFQKFFWLFEQCPVQPLWVLGMRCLHLPVRALSKVLLLPVWVWLVLPSTAYSKGMLPLDLWCQASLQGLPERQHLGKTVHCWGSFLECSGLDGADEKSVRNEGWSHNG